MRAVTKPRPTEHACSFDTFLSALDNPAPAFVGEPRTLRNHVGERRLDAPLAVAVKAKRAPALGSDRALQSRIYVVPTSENAPSEMMLPATSPFWIGVTHVMRARQDQIAFSCALVAGALFIMMLARVAWAYIGGML